MHSIYIGQVFDIGGKTIFGMGMDTVKGEVVEVKKGLTMVRIPGVEEKLREEVVPTVSKRQSLLEKLRIKKLISE